MFAEFSQPPASVTNYFGKKVGGTLSDRYDLAKRKTRLWLSRICYMTMHDWAAQAVIRGLTPPARHSLMAFVQTTVCPGDTISL